MVTLYDMFPFVTLTEVKKSKNYLINTDISMKIFHFNIYLIILRFLF